MAWSTADIGAYKGAAAEVVEHTSEGTLEAQVSTIAGTAELEHKATGVLDAQLAVIAGTAELEHTSTGALEAQVSTLAGLGYVAPPQPRHIRPATMLYSQQAVINGTGDVI